MKFIIQQKTIIKKILSVYIGVLLLLSQSIPLYAQGGYATPSASIEEATPSAEEATPSAGTSSVEASPSAIIETPQDTPSTPSAIITTPIPTPEILLGPSGVLSPSASIKLPPHIRPMTKRTFRAGEVASVVVENIDISTIKATVRDTNGVSIETTPSVDMYDGGIRVMFIPKTSFKPGKYTIIVQDTTTGTTLTQDFLWGVLAFNTDQATYAPGDTATIALAVLDEKGMMVCDADVTLTILSPTRQKTILKTGDGSIRVTPECQLHAFTLKPDYETTFQTSDEGVYVVTLTAKTTNGTYAIQDSFQASSDMPFQVKRTSATRIFPPEAYPMTIDITANEDFSGVVTETIPENFTITPLDGSIPYTDVKIVAPVTDLHSHTPISIGMPFEGNYPVTLGFGERLKDPKLKAQYQEFGLKGHDGADFAMPEGTRILAVDSGKVVRIADEPYGTTVVIDHTWGRSYYGHLSTVQVKEGDAVAKGAPIALSGKTGLTTGPHLHFGMKLTKNDMGNGYYGKIDPMPYVTSSVIYQSDRSGRQISWNVTIKKNENIRLGYTYKAPGISPQFYLLGPLTFRTTNAAVPAPTVVPDNPFVLGVATESASPLPTLSPENISDTQTNTIVYQEVRQWQIASDANTTYLSGSGNWTSPITGNVSIECWGGGGAGGGQNATSDGGGGGGGGAYAKVNTYAVTKGNTYAYAVGSGGTGVASSKGNNGGTTTFVSTICVALGGTGGSPSTGTPPAGGAGGVGASGTGNVKYSGGQGEIGRNNTTGQGGYGGSSAGTAANGYSGPQTFSTITYPTASTPAGAGHGGNGGGAGVNGSAPASGSGGGGGGSGDGTARVGGAGANGKIIITYADNTPPTVVLNSPIDGATGQSTTPTLDFIGNDVNGDNIEYNVQVDTANTFDSQGGGFDLKYIDVFLKKIGLPTDNLTVEIRTTIGGVSIGTSNAVVASSLTTTYNLTRFTFATPITLSGTSKYYFVIRRSGSSDGSNVCVVSRSNDLYSNIESYKSLNGVWQLASTSQDIIFILYDTSMVSRQNRDGANFAGAYIYGETNGGDEQAEGQSFLLNTFPLISALSATDAGFSGMYGTTQWPSGQLVTYTVQSALTPGTTYYWRVRAIDPSGSNTYGEWSSIYSFTTAAGGGGGPTTDQQMRHGTWFNNNVKQPFTF